MSGAILKEVAVEVGKAVALDLAGKALNNLSEHMGNSQGSGGNSAEFHACNMLDHFHRNTQNGNVIAFRCGNSYTKGGYTSHTTHTAGSGITYTVYLDAIGTWSNDGAMGWDNWCMSGHFDRNGPQGRVVVFRGRDIAREREQEAMERKLRVLKAESEALRAQMNDPKRAGEVRVKLLENAGKVVREAALAKDPTVCSLAVFGLQSVGKSTLLNMLFGLNCKVGPGKTTRGVTDVATVEGIKIIDVYGNNDKDIYEAYDTAVKIGGLRIALLCTTSGPDSIYTIDNLCKQGSVHRLVVVTRCNERSEADSAELCAQCKEELGVATAYKAADRADEGTERLLKAIRALRDTCPRPTRHIAASTTPCKDDDLI